MKEEQYHYTECGLDNIYLINGFNFFETARGKAVSINDVDGLHRAIGLTLVQFKKDLSGREVRFLREELLISQRTLADLLGLSEQTVQRWEAGTTIIPKPSEALLRLLYREHVHEKKDSTIHGILKRIAQLEDEIDDQPILFKDTTRGWKQTAA